MNIWSDKDKIGDEILLKFMKFSKQRKLKINVTNTIV